MTTKTLTGIIAATLATVLLLVAAAGGAILTTGIASACTTPAASATTPTATPLSGWPPLPADASPGPVTDCTGQTVLDRAAIWLTAWNGGPVPYLSSTNPATGCRWR